MLKDAVAVIDLGSFKLTALIGENGINNNFTIRSISQIEHDAFDDGNLNENKLYAAMSESLKTISSAAKARLDRVFIGLAGEFVRITNKEHNAYFNRRRKIRAKDLTDFYDGAAKSLVLGDYEVISREPVCLYTDGNMPVENPVGAVSASLWGYVTFVAAKSTLLNSIRKIAMALGVKEVIFIPVPIAEGRLLFSQEERRATQILVDIGYLTTSLTVLTGGGALYQSDFPIGGGYITAHLYNELEIDFDVAEKLKRKINLNIVGNTGNYDVVYGDTQYSFPVKKVNEIGKFVIDEIAEQFDKAVLSSRVKLPHNLAVSLTGGGISYLRGGSDYLSSRIEMPVNIICPKIAYQSKPDDSSVLSVLNYALNEKAF